MVTPMPKVKIPSAVTIPVFKEMNWLLNTVDIRI